MKRKDTENLLESKRIRYKFNCILRFKFCRMMMQIGGEEDSCAQRQIRSTTDFPGPPSALRPRKRKGGTTRRQAQTNRALERDRHLRKAPHRMRVPLFLLALVASVSASAWSDADKVSTTAGRESFHGPGLIYKGEVWNGDKTKRFTADYSYIAKSVITGKDSYYPKTLPATLKTPYLVADSTHPNLAFW